MGCTQSEEMKEALRRHNELQKKIRQVEKTKIAKNEFSIMLLGSGESGKTTVIRQMKENYGNGFSKQEIINHIPLIYENIITSMTAITNAMESFKISFQSENMEEVAMAFRSNQVTTETLSIYWDDIKAMVKDEHFLEAMSKSNQYQLSDSTPYFFSNLDRIFHEDYMPTSQDIMRSRVKTTSVIKSVFHIENITINVFDVGGQRCERKKWIGNFDDITGIIFVIALSEYNLTLEEDQTTNRTEETLKLLASVSKMLNGQIPFILFFNKSDLFREKLKTFPLQEYFKEYKGGEDFDKGVEFMSTMYKEAIHPKDREVHYKTTTATDTENMKFIFNFVIKTLTEKNLQECGF